MATFMEDERTPRLIRVGVSGHEESRNASRDHRGHGERRDEPDPGPLVRLRAGRRAVEISNPDKVFYPETGFTKADVVRYYQDVADVLLPHVKKRLVTLKRYPNGVDGPFFYEKQCPKHRPDWIGTAPMRRKDGKVIDYCLLNDRAALAWASNLANLELHTSLARDDRLDRPRSLVFDLDPGEVTDVLDCAQVALWIREVFSDLGLDSFAKTSGSKGIQMFVPVAVRLESEHPGAIVTKQSKEARRGKVLIDWSQNDDHKTTVSVYSLRARARPTVSTPVAWDEVEAALASDDAGALVFESHEVLARIDKHGDLFEPVLKLRQKLPPPPAYAPKGACATTTQAPENVRSLLLLLLGRCADVRPLGVIAAPDAQAHEREGRVAGNEAVLTAGFPRQVRAALDDAALLRRVGRVDLARVDVEGDVEVLGAGAAADDLELELAVPGRRVDLDHAGERACGGAAGEDPGTAAPAGPAATGDLSVRAGTGEQDGAGLLLLSRGRAGLRAERGKRCDDGRREGKNYELLHGAPPRFRPSRGVR